jgi:UDP-N-acetylmuramoyl-L-alanyl-D-glutamate--2,6-diaminopimelate ligase
LLLAGKGHEKYQEIKGSKQHFDDKEELLSAFNIMQRIVVGILQKFNE